MTQLLEPSITVGTLVWLLSSVDPDMLDQLVVGAEGLETLLALDVGFSSRFLSWLLIREMENVRLSPITLSTLFRWIFRVPEECESDPKGLFDASF
ncbi:unnamed protein product [Pieris macdunnoughi]|uniref:Uncharacterized protein n=1 Tax=Pieris macdunnoughi TaxID=345717 RepID=A0A821WFM5_9NEOP|nr:unnamed protein product [Pieris macdunnoughi]